MADETAIQHRGPELVAWIVKAGLPDEFYMKLYDQGVRVPSDMQYLKQVLFLLLCAELSSWSHTLACYTLGAYSASLRRDD